jgi:hypothetical protein
MWTATGNLEELSDSYKRWSGEKQYHEQSDDLAPGIRSFLQNHTAKPLDHYALQWLNTVQEHLKGLQGSKLSFADILGDEPWKRVTHDIVCAPDKPYPYFKQNTFITPEIIEDFRKLHAVLEALLGKGVSVEAAQQTIRAHMKRNVDLGLDYAEALPGEDTKAKVKALEHAREGLSYIYGEGSKECRAVESKIKAYYDAKYQAAEDARKLLEQRKREELEQQIKQIEEEQRRKWDEESRERARHWKEKGKKEREEKKHQIQNGERAFKSVSVEKIDNIDDRRVPEILVRGAQAFAFFGKRAAPHVSDVQTNLTAWSAQEPALADLRMGRDYVLRQENDTRVVLITNNPELKEHIATRTQRNGIKLSIRMRQTPRKLAQLSPK